jgi:aspartyl-tRNA(Asn)/glutamyl-tRNA(Gln) amidotransferase subunit A
MNTGELAHYSLSEIADLISNREVSSVEATTACLRAIASLQPQLNCYITIEADEALMAARRADSELARGQRRGPLHGVPVAHKDMFYRVGKVSTGGADILRHHVPDVTATVVKRLDEGGAIGLGNLNMSEFAANPTGHNVHFGDCHNPWSVTHITGGSSSGAAAAVAARTCYAALGSDTGGSVRVPAAMCGVCGIKPTYGRISRANIMPRAWSVDTVGVLARTAEDCAMVTGVVAGHDPADVTTADVAVPNYRALLQGSVNGIKIGIPADSFFSDIDPDVRRALDASLLALGALGARTFAVPLPDFSTLAVISDAITKCEAAAIHRRWFSTRFDDYSLFVRSRLEAGFHIPAACYLEAVANRGRVLGDFVRSVFGMVDVLHLPVVSMSVPTLFESDVNAAGDVPALISRITRFSRPINYLGLPSLSVPCGFTPNGLPTAFQLVGRPYSESLLFRLAHAYQQTTDWHRRAPPICEPLSASPQ